MKEIIYDYLVTSDKKVIKARQLYEIYCLLEEAEGRTPLTRHVWNAAFYSYFNQIYKFVIRAGYTYPMRYGMGSLSISCHNEFRWRFRFRWVQPLLKLARRWGNIYSFKAVDGDTNFGQTALSAWASEAKKGDNMTGMTYYD